MLSDVTREEFKHWTARVDVVESEIEGEKKVTRHILEHSRHHTGLLANVLTRLGGVEARVGGTEKRLDGVEKRLDGVDKRLNGVEKRLDGMERRLGGVETGLTKLDRKVDGLIKSLPTIVGDAVRKAMGGRGKR